MTLADEGAVQRVSLLMSVQGLQARGARATAPQSAEVQWESALRNIASRTLSVLSDCEGERDRPSWDLFDFWSGKSKTD